MAQLRTTLYSITNNTAGTQVHLNDHNLGFHSHDMLEMNRPFGKFQKSKDVNLISQSLLVAMLSVAIAWRS